MAAACLAEHNHELEIPQCWRRHAGNGVDRAVAAARKQVNVLEKKSSWLQQVTAC